ncbi:hypothetical protein SKAU_G00060840 [Synaphobranchus kaupii]|uniref:ribonuclease H n=1 Tax=Synaphobranchus kaupii TaxID=118154 RepID=A0A9Q1G602_SYNKA|nr:hypothetical protein SKAU_G00060840 [Synaphobranchus kaupii]
MTLADAVVIGKQLETAVMEARKFSRAVHEPVTSSTPSIQHVAQEEAVAVYMESLNVHKVTDGVSRESGPRRCGNCGSLKHGPRDQSCPALGKRCRHCHKLNHFARWCHSPPAQSPSAAVPINIVQSQWATFRHWTQAKVSLLNKVTYGRYFSHVPLDVSANSLSGYGHTPISILGVACLPVEYNCQHAPDAKFYITRTGANIMGLDLFHALNFSLTDAGGLRVLQVTTSWPDRHPKLFEGLGCMSGFIHQPTADSSVRPVIQPLRRIPPALRDAVEEELRRFAKADVIEPVNTSPWVSNLVVARKKGGGLHLCVDLTDVNKAIIPDRFPWRHPAKTLTFVTHVGVFRYKHMAFGLSSAPSCFQKIMSLILAGIQGVSMYLDDVVVHAPSTALHNARLEQVFQRFRQHNVTLNAEKCVFGAEEVEFLGFRLQGGHHSDHVSH